MLEPCYAHHADVPQCAAAAVPAPPAPTASHRPVLGREASFWVSAGVVAHAFWTSAAPAMAYPLYAEQWHLTHTVTTAIFAIYPIVVVAVLIAFGAISDYVGRRRTMLIGIGASLFGVLLFALAPDVLWLFAGRAFMGLGVGLSAGPSTAAVVEFSGAGQPKRASSITTASQSAGFVAALLIGGALIQYAPFPTRLSFWVLAAVLAALWAVTWFLPERTAARPPGRWRPRTPSIPADLRRPFILSSLAVTTAYTHGVLILSLGAQIAHELIGSPNTLVNGAALALFALVTGIVGIVAKPMPARRALILGSLASALSMALMALAVAGHELAVFLAATATGGAGYALLFLGGIEVINAAAPADHRGGVLSAIYLSAYLSLGVVALLLGVIATARGLQLAVNLGAGVIGLMSAASLTLAVVFGASIRTAPAPQPG